MMINLNKKETTARAPKLKARVAVGNLSQSTGFGKADAKAAAARKTIASQIDATNAGLSKAAKSQPPKPVEKMAQKAKLLGGIG